MRATPVWWRPGLFGVVAVAIVVRIVFTLAVAPDLPPPGDAEVYRRMAHELASGDGLRYPAPGGGPAEPTAEHPPLFPILLAGFDLVGLDSVQAQGLALSVLAGVGVALMAFLGRRIGGPVVGLVAAVIAALHPMWTQSPGLVLVESLHLVLVPAVLLLALELLRRPRGHVALYAGLLVGLAALDRSESLGLFVVTLGPAAILGAPRRQAARLLLVAGLAVVILLVPWLGRNAAQVGGWTMSTNGGKTLLGSNCDGTYSGPGLGGFDYDCQFGAATYLVQQGAPGGGTWDGKAFDDALGHSGRQYVQDHRGQVPKVVVARVARMWGVAFATDQRAFDVGEGRDVRWQHAGQLLHLALLPFAIAGAIVLLWSRQWREGLILLGPVLLVTATCLVLYGGTRMRSGAEPSVAVFAAFALVVAVRTVRGLWGRTASAEGSDGIVSPT